MIAAVPELRRVFRTLQAEDDRAQRQRYYQTVALAYKATLEDPGLADSIKTLVANRLRDAFRKLQPSAGLPPQMQNQSNNQADRSS